MLHCSPQTNHLHFPQSQPERYRATRVTGPGGSYVTGFHDSSGMHCAEDAPTAFTRRLVERCLCKATEGVDTTDGFAAAPATDPHDYHCLRLSGRCAPTIASCSCGPWCHIHPGSGPPCSPAVRAGANDGCKPSSAAVSANAATSEWTGACYACHRVCFPSVTRDVFSRASTTACGMC